MPIYEYICETCGSEFEVIQKFSDPELKRHDCAPKSKVHRKLSLTSFHLQGGGWYASGYGANGSSNGSSGKNGGSNGKTETPAAKPDSSGAAKSDGGGAAKAESGVSASAGCGASCACH